MSYRGFASSRRQLPQLLATFLWLQFVGNPMEATANDLCALVNQASGCAACAKAVLFLEEEWMLGASLIGDYVMDCNDCIREHFRGIFLDMDE